MAGAIGTADLPPGGWSPSEFELHLDHLRWPCGCMRFNLTEREADVLELVAEGRSTSEAAQDLFVSHQAVTYHVGNLLGKFQCTNRAGLVARAFVLGVLERSWPPKVLPRDTQRPRALVRCRHLRKDPGPRRTLSQR